MAWPAGRRRNTTDGRRFLRAVCAEFGCREIARRLGVSDRTVRRWASGEDWCGAEILHCLVDAICTEPQGSLPIYSVDLAIDGNTRVAGVGEYSRRAAQGDLEYVAEVIDE